LDPSSPQDGHVNLYRYVAASDSWQLTDEIAGPSRGYAYEFADTLAFDGTRLIVGATHGPSTYVYDLDVATGTLALRGT
jgi:xylose isomerase